MADPEEIPLQAEAQAQAPARRVFQKPEGAKFFHTIYPQHLDSNFTPEQGRKISQCKAVEGPTLEEIFLALRQMGYTAHYGDPLKTLPCLQSSQEIYPAPRGCIKVGIKTPKDSSDPEGKKRTAVVPQYKTKGEVLRKLAEIIKAMPDRKPMPGPDNSGKGAKKAAAEEAAREAKKKKKGGSKKR